MQNYLSKRYRRVYDRIKETRGFNIKEKLAKNVTDVKMILNGLSPATNIGKEVVKFPYELTSKIIHFPYLHYWRKYWIIKCSTITMFLFMPAFYNFYKSKKAHNTKWQYNNNNNNSNLKEICEPRKEVQAKTNI